MISLMKNTTYDSTILSVTKRLSATLITLLFGASFSFAQVLRTAGYEHEQNKAPEPARIVYIEKVDVACGVPQVFDPFESEELLLPASFQQQKRVQPSKIVTASGSILSDFERDITEPELLPEKLSEPKPNRNSGITPAVPSNRNKFPRPTLADNFGQNSDEEDNDYEIINSEYGQEFECGPDGNYQYYAPGGTPYYTYTPGMEYMYFTEPEHSPVSSWLFDNLSVFSGARVFNDDINLRHKGSFSFEAGANWAGPLIVPLRLSGQLGGQVVYSNLNSSSMMPNYYFEDKQTRTQYFVTGGLFKRMESFPLQVGIVYDWYLDETYESIQLGQIRTDLSVWTQTGIELGFRGTFPTNSKTVTLNHYDPFTNEIWHSRYDIEPRTFYSLYGKINHLTGANGMLTGGLSERGDFHCGLEYEVPITNCITAKSGISYTYLDGHHAVSNEKRENWDFWLTFVFYPHGRTSNGIHNPLRPLFDVANPSKVSTKFSYRGSYTGP